MTPFIAFPPACELEKFLADSVRDLRRFEAMKGHGKAFVGLLHDSTRLAAM